MVSKKQAAAVGDALAQGNRSRPQRPPYRFRFYPELDKIPPPDRDVALKDAKRRALRSFLVVALSCFYLLFLVLVLYSREPGPEWLQAFVAGLVSATSVWVVVFRWRVRRELLRSDWRPRVSPLSEFVSTSSDE